MIFGRTPHQSTELVCGQKIELMDPARHPLSAWKVSFFPLEIRQWQFYLVENAVSFLSGLLKFVWGQGER